MRNEVKIQEVGPRDGLQNEKTILEPEQRAHLIESLIKSGLTRIQVGSFVNRKILPQMAQTAEVFNLLGKRENVRFSALVLNMKGVDSAIRCGIEHLEIFVSASESHSLKNTGKSVAEALKASRMMIREAAYAGLTITAGVMCAFGCTFEGRVEIDSVKRIVDCFADFQFDEICLADTTGQGTPELLTKTMQSLVSSVPLEKMSLHLHDTYGNAEKNLLEALDIGVRMFDASIGGLGGCPFIPGAAGNIATEKVVSLIHAKGFSTGVDINELELAKMFLWGLLGPKRRPHNI